MSGYGELSESDSWDRLAGGSLGRLAVSVDGQPDVFPVNYAVQDRTIVIRTAEGTKLASVVVNALVAFEADDHDVARGWSVVVHPGFAHESVPVLRWKLHIAPDTGEVLGREVDGPLAPRERPVQKLMLPEREGAWLLTLGIEIDGETLDLAPLLADLLRRDPRWLNAQQMAAIDDLALIKLRAPGGKRIEAPAGPLKAIVGAMVDLLTDFEFPGGGPRYAVMVGTLPLAPYPPDSSSP